MFSGDLRTAKHKTNIQLLSNNRSSRKNKRRTHRERHAFYTPHSEAFVPGITSPAHYLMQIHLLELISTFCVDHFPLRKAAGTAEGKSICSLAVTLAMTDNSCQLTAPQNNSQLQERGIPHGITYCSPFVHECCDRYINYFI